MATLLQCNLCSATNNLISLFSGAYNENYIRKIVAETTGIKFTQNDLFKYICLICVEKIYNFHLFKMRSAENVDHLQSINSNTERRTFKFEIPRIDDTKLPNLDELKYKLTETESQCAKKDCCNKTSFTQTIIDTTDVETQ